MASNYDLIRAAIQNKQQVFATFGGHPRELCPHVIGTKNGRPQALFYQFGGSSSSGTIALGAPGNWRCLPIEGLSNVSVRVGQWHSGSNHSRPQTCVDVVDVEVI